MRSSVCPSSTFTSRTTEQILIKISKGAYKFSFRLYRSNLTPFLLEAEIEQYRFYQNRLVL